MSSRHEWVEGPVKPEVWQEAREIRQARFEHFGWAGAFDGAKQYHDRENPEIGEVGEICLRRWLTLSGAEFEWLNNDVRYDPDFIIHGQSVDVKTRHRKSSEKVGEADQFGVRECYIHKGYDWFFFCGYSRERNILTFYGAIPSWWLEINGVIVQPGEEVRPGRKVLTPDPSYEVPIGALLGPYRWLETLKSGLRAR
jgi:hypothetical protein